VLESRACIGLKFCAVFVFSAMLTPLCATVAWSQASVSVQGHVEEYDGPSRLTRPGRRDEPRRPNVSGHKKGLSLSAGTTGSVLSPHKFKFGQQKEAPAADPFHSLSGNAAENNERSKELMLAWDEWHKRVISAFYERWKNGTDISGQAKVTVIVSRDGDLDCSCSEFEQSDAHYDSSAEDAFKQAVRNAILAVAKTPTVEFPALSQRREVKIVTTFSMNMLGPSGYSYKRGDTERVRLPVGKN
jgi:hypothetical protein